MDERNDFTVPTLGKATIPNPAKAAFYHDDDDRILYDIRAAGCRATFEKGEAPPSFEPAGPREKIYFDPSKSRAAIVTCGGLCPGMNDVIRALVMELYHRYGVRNIYGIRFGFQGFIPAYGHEPL
ncbi:MAG: 6-phosphofructokinase, partial [bacterium]